MKQKYGGEQSRGSAKISWVRRELQGRTARVAVEGPDGAPAGTIRRDGCEKAPLVETTPIPALQPLLRGHGKVRHPSRLWRRWARTNARGRGQLPSPTAPQHPKLPMTCCHRSALRHFPRTRPDRSRLQRDAGQVGKKGWEKPLYVARARHAESEPTWARSLRSSAPLFFPHRSLGGRKREGARGGVALWKESDPRAQRGETDVLAVRTIRASELGICMGFPQAGNALAVAVIGMQGRPARTAVTARHLQPCQFALLGAWDSPDGGSEQDRNCCDAGAWRRRISRADWGRWVQLRGVSTASRLLGQCRRSRRRWRRRNLRILWRNGRLYSQMVPPILARSGGFRRHRLVQLRCRPIGSFFTHCTNQ